MVIAAHPDDADFGPAGTAARWIDEGARRGDWGWPALSRAVLNDPGGHPAAARS